MEQQKLKQTLQDELSNANKLAQHYQDELDKVNERIVEINKTLLKENVDDYSKYLHKWIRITETFSAVNTTDVRYLYVETISTNSQGYPQLVGWQLSRTTIFGFSFDVFEKNSINVASSNRKEYLIEIVDKETIETLVKKRISNISKALSLTFAGKDITPLTTRATKRKIDGQTLTCDDDIDTIMNMDNIEMFDLIMDDDVDID